MTTPGTLTHQSGQTYKRQSTTVLVDDLGEIALVFGETASHANDIGAEIARRYNAYPAILEALRNLVEVCEVNGFPSVFVRAGREQIEKAERKP